METAEYYGEQNTNHCYDEVDFDVYKPRAPKTLCYMSHDERFKTDKIKAKEPDPCTYQIDEQHLSSNVQSPRAIFTQSKKVNYVESAAKSKEWVPPIGTYDCDEALAKITKGFSPFYYTYK